MIECYYDTCPNHAQTEPFCNLDFCVATKDQLDKYAEIRRANNQIKIYYMRDNHTFKPLSLNLPLAIEQIREEWDKGYTYGMLCSKSPEAPKKPEHAHGNWEEFKSQVESYYQQIKY